MMGNLIREFNFNIQEEKKDAMNGLYSLFIL